MGNGEVCPVSWIKMLWKTLHVSGVGVHLKYETTKAPRRGDRVLMKMTMGVCKDEGTLLSFCRVRGFLEVILLSGITTIDGKYLEE